MREKGYDDSTSLMSDAEVLLKILEAKIDVNMSLIFDQSGKLFKSSRHLREEDLPKWVLARSGRFVRFVKRLRNRSARTTRRRGMMSNRSAQTVVCKMASAFIYCVCIMFKIDTKNTIKCWKKMESLLIPVDEESGTVDLKLDDKKKKYTPASQSQPVTKHSHVETLKIPDGIIEEREVSDLTNNSDSKEQAESFNQTMAQIPYHKLTMPTESIDHVPMELPSLEQAQIVPSDDVRSSTNDLSCVPQNNEKKRDDVTGCKGDSPKVMCNSGVMSSNFETDRITIEAKSSPIVPAFDPRSGKTENEYNIASALMMLTATPTRVKTSENQRTIVAQETLDLQDSLSFNRLPTQGTTDSTQNRSHGFGAGSNPTQQKAAATKMATSRPTLFDAKQTVATTIFNQPDDVNFIARPDAGTKHVQSPSHGFRMDHVQAKQPHDEGEMKNTIIQKEDIVDVTSCTTISRGMSNGASLTEAALLLSAANGASAAQIMRNSNVINYRTSTSQSSTGTGAEKQDGNIGEKLPNHIPLDSSVSNYAQTETTLSANKNGPVALESQLPDNSLNKKSCDLDAALSSTDLKNEKISIDKSSDEFGNNSAVLMASKPNKLTETSLASTPSDAKKDTHKSDSPEKVTSTPGLNESNDVILKSKTSGQKDQAQIHSSPTKNMKVHLPWFTHNLNKVKPVMGWDSLSGENSTGMTKWMDSRTCCLCNIPGDDDAGLESEISFNSSNKMDRIKGSGRLLPLPGGGWIHANCALWSSEVWENPVGGVLDGVGKAKARSTKLRCFGCGQIGATLGCHKSNCNANYHFACAKACGAVFTSSHKFYCAAHAPKQDAKIELIEHFSEPMKILKVVDDRYEADTSLCYRSGSLVVHSLGKIESDKDGFHSKEYILSAGFSSTRIFWSFVKPKTRTVYFMNIIRSPKNTAFFTVTAADAPSQVFKGDDVSKVYNDVMQRVKNMNKDFFSHGDLFSVYPMERSKNNRPAFCLNGPQFFGFGVNCIREAMEKSANAASLIVPLAATSTPYQFCFQNPTQQSVTDLQRKRALLKAEKDLENATGCARTEGIGAINKSKGSGRITRALVRSDKDNSSPSRSRALAKGAASSSEGGRDPRARNDATSREFESTQAKYREMKSVPMEQRLAAKRSHIHGWGLFAKKDYPKNSMIAEYMGEGISQPVADKREKMYEVLGMGSCYMFRLDLNEIVDATQIGCMARFMNHCCSANAYANIITVNTERGLEKKIVVFANQDIKRGDEITYDYKFPVEDGSLRCTCGAPNCIGRMN